MHALALVRRGAYADSITLMHVAEAVRAQPEVKAAALVMGTAANLAALAEAGLATEEARGAGPGDLVIAVGAATAAAAREALALAEEQLAARRAEPAESAGVAPRSLTSAARRAQGARAAVIAVPGAHAAAEAHQALSAGLDVFIFSDGVSLADEIDLKRRARARGRLVMGPECGTAILDGLGIGFANAVRRGSVGLVGASGTGLQEVTCLLHALGAGVSHAIGTGGRDLHEGVGGLTTLSALERLAADEATEVIVLVSKPASPAVADAVLGVAAELGKPVIGCLLGWRGATRTRVQVVPTLEEAAVAAARAVGVRRARFARPRIPETPTTPGRVAGFFTGGTLCAEAKELVGDTAARFVDFGAEEYTRGRPHPMIDPGLRTAAIVAAGDDADVGVLLLDVVLGYCAHPDPAGTAAVAVREARARAAAAGRALAAVARVVGTELDPQGLAGQVAALRRTGVVVCPSNRSAALTARALALGPAGHAPGTPR